MMLVFVMIGTVMDFDYNPCLLLRKFPFCTFCNFRVVGFLGDAPRSQLSSCWLRASPFLLFIPPLPSFSLFHSSVLPSPLYCLIFLVFFPLFPSLFLSHSPLPSLPPSHPPRPPCFPLSLLPTLPFHPPCSSSFTFLRPAFSPAERVSM